MAGAAETIEKADYETTAREDDLMDLRLWLRLLTCSTLIEGRVRRNLREVFATTLPRFDILAQLDRAPTGLTMGELSRRLMVSSGNVTGVINHLVSEGLVDRRPGSRDRRVQVVCLTAKGRKNFARMAKVNQDWMTGLSDGLNRTKTRELFDLLGELKQSVLAWDQRQEEI